MTILMLSLVQSIGALPAPIDALAVSTYINEHFDLGVVPSQIEKKLEKALALYEELAKKPYQVIHDLDLYLLVFIDQKGDIRPIDGRHSYKTRQSAYRRCRQANAIYARSLD